MGNKLLVVGPLPNEKYNCQWGGATVLMKNFRDYLLAEGVKHRFVQTNKYVNPRTLELRPRANQLHFIANFVAALPFCDTVMFNFSDHGTVNMFPMLSEVARRMGKRVVLRKFGGSFDVYLQSVPDKKKRRVVSALQEADLIFFETKAGIAHLKGLIGGSDKIHWFPNVRSKAPQQKDPRQFGGRLVYMSHITDEKGVGCLLNTFARLPKGYSLDFYGAIKEKSYENFDWASHGVSYMGEVSSTELLRKLTEYDLLLLPSCYREGYPGIIIEAMSVGMPVITTKVGGIPEIIKDGVNGKLVTPGSVNELAEGILSIDKQNYTEYCNNAYATFCEQFESKKTNDRIVSTICNVTH